MDDEKEWCNEEIYTEKEGTRQRRMEKIVFYVHWTPTGDESLERWKLSFAIRSHFVRLKLRPRTEQHCSTLSTSAQQFAASPPKAEHVLRKIHHCTFLTRTYNIRSLEAGQTILGMPKNQIYQVKFLNDFFYHCTNILSSHHISSHHCTFCASLHVKTSPALTRNLHSLKTNLLCLNCYYQL